MLLLLGLHRWPNCEQYLAHLQLLFNLDQQIGLFMGQASISLGLEDVVDTLAHTLHELGLKIPSSYIFEMEDDSSITFNEITISIKFPNL